MPKRGAGFRTICCLLVALLGIAGCRAATSDTGSPDLQWKKLAEFGGDVDKYAQYLDEQGMRPIVGNEFAYMGREPRLLVLTDVTDMAALQNQILFEHQQQIAKVNFSRFWVAVIYKGYTKHLGHTISVDAVQFLSDTVTIAAQFEAPPTSTPMGAGHPSTPSISPYLVVKIQKPTNVIADELHFNLSVGGQTIPAQCALRGNPLSWTKLRNYGHAGEYSYGGTSPNLNVIVDYDTWKTSGGVPAYDMSLMSQKDFSSAFAVIIYQGMKSTTGFEIEVLSIRQQENVTLICVRFQEPYPGQALGQMVTSPYYLVKVDRVAEMQGDVTFVLCTDTQEISRQTIIFPPQN